MMIYRLRKRYFEFVIFRVMFKVEIISKIRYGVGFLGSYKV